MPTIHPTAIIDPLAQLADDVSVAAYGIIKGRVLIGPGTVIHEHSHIHGHTIIGSRCRIGPAAYVGMDPQHLKYSGEQTRLDIGDDCVIRECASIHRSMYSKPGHLTRLGNRCFIMANAHVGHDSVLGDDVVLANAVLIAGHCTIGDRAFLGGGFGLHQFCRVGRLAVIAGNEGLSQDIPPFAAVRYRGMKGYNAVGCRRAGFGAPTLVAIRAAFRCFHTHRTTSAAVQAIRDEVPQLPEVMEILDFIAASRRGIVPSLAPLRSRRASGARANNED